MRTSRGWVAVIVTSMLVAVGCVSDPDVGDGPAISSETEAAIPEADGGTDADGATDTDGAAEPEPASDATTSTEAPPSSTPTGAEPVAATAEVYASTFDPEGGSDLYELVDGEFVPLTALVGPDGPVQITDIALSSGGVLYGSTFSELVRIDIDSGDVEIVGVLASAPVNALAFLPDGRLLGADLDGVVSFIDVETAAVETLTTYPAGLVSSGDFAVDEDGTVFATATDGDLEYLLTLDSATGAVESRSSLLPADVWGLLTQADGTLIGLTFESASGQCPSGEMVRLSAHGNSFEPLGCLDFAPGGATERQS